MEFNPREYELSFMNKDETIIESNFINPTEEQLREAGMTDKEFDPNIYEKVFCRINNIPYTLEEQLKYIFGE